MSETPPSIAAQLKRMEAMATRYRMLAEPTRLQILNAIGEGEVNVQEICDRTGFKQANVSRHLRLLRDSGAIACRQEGLFHYYRLVDPIVRQCLHCTQSFCQQGTLDWRSPWENPEVSTQR